MPFSTRVSLGAALLAAVGCGSANDVHDAGEPPLAMPIAAALDAASASPASADSAQSDAGTAPPVRHPTVGTIGFEGLDPSAAAPMNDTFETAALIAPGGGAHQDVVRYQQSNFFFFDVSEAGFVELSTPDREYSADVVISVYDPERRLIAENDEGSLWPNDSFDARVVLRVNRPGRYYVKVSDLKTSADFFQQSGASLLYYHLDLRLVTGTTTGFGIAGSMGDTPVQFAMDDTTGYSFVTLVGTLEPSAARAFAFDGLPAHALIGHLLPAGVPGNGSTATAGRVRVLNAAQRVLGELDGRRGDTKLYPPVAMGRTLVSVEAPDTVGDNGFFALDLVMLPENPVEQNEAANNQLAGAEPITLKGAPTKRGLLLSDVPPGDVDYYAFNALDGAHIAVSCEAQSAGSGVRSLRVEVRDESDQSLAVCTESAEHDLHLDAWPVPHAGKYFLRLASDPQVAPADAEPWVRCVFFMR